MQPTSPSWKPLSSQPAAKLPSKLQAWNDKREKRRKMRLCARLLFAMMLIALILSLTACASLCPTTPDRGSPVQLPSPPALTTPTPSQSYSSSAAQDISKWREKLMATPTTPKP